MYDLFNVYITTNSYWINEKLEVQKINLSGIDWKHFIKCGWLGN